MYKKVFFAAASIAAVIGNLSAQPRKMTSVGGGASDHGKCTIEVVVDGSAEVEIHGDTATLRNLGGASPQWRRFECTGPLPSNPADFRFMGVDGRGRQQLLRDPRNGGSAVIRIDDPDSGSQGYTFDVLWGRAAPPPPVQSRGNDGGFDRQASPQNDPRQFDRQAGPQNEPRQNDRQAGPQYDPRQNDPRRGIDGDRDSYHSEREDAFRGGDWRMHLFVRIREDLDHVQTVAFPGGDQYRIERVRQQLNRLQDMQDQGRYDQRQLDAVVTGMTRIVADNRLSARDRDVLNDDLNRLKDFRQHFGNYGVR